jgi:hypothetical protein
MHRSPLKKSSFRDGLNKATFINIRGELPLPQYIFRYNPSSVAVCMHVMLNLRSGLISDALAAPDLQIR